ncbi:hypothetical protein CVT24_007542 [Panaeolus cyanescens]|uniref:Uncharacterized protein n=1 Tax=Panaeolus cyanescens TaxID=181874 RepID=A0A409WLG0_9AGAR|nr:hypothetical protein CVT24_007542 [Panaeolus cyanescens]
MSSSTKAKKSKPVGKRPTKKRAQNQFSSPGRPSNPIVIPSSPIRAPSIPIPDLEPPEQIVFGPPPTMEEIRNELLEMEAARWREGLALQVLVEVMAEQEHEVASAQEIEAATKTISAWMKVNTRCCCHIIEPFRDNALHATEIVQGIRAERLRKATLDLDVAEAIRRIALSHVNQPPNHCR